MRTNKRGEPLLTTEAWTAREAALREAAELVLSELSTKQYDGSGEDRISVGPRVLTVAIELHRRANEARLSADAASRPGPKRKSEGKVSTGRISTSNAILALLPEYRFRKRPGRKRDASIPTDRRMAILVDRAMATGRYRFEREALELVLRDHMRAMGKNTASIESVARVVRQSQKRLINYRKRRVRDSGT